MMDVNPVDGELTPAGGRWQLRFTRRIAHPAEKVWRALVEPEHLAAWFPQRIVGDRAVGARLRFEDDQAGIDAFEGEVLRYEPPRVFEFTWGTDVLRLELEPDGDHTVLTLLDTFDEQGKAARDAAGWHECLDRLGADLDGTPPGAWGATWREVHSAYVARFGPAAATIGPPEGHDPAAAS
jgi:uncharacterized protein YndB with AHSA1/START domain